MTTRAIDELRGYNTYYLRTLLTKSFTLFIDSIEDGADTRELLIKEILRNLAEEKTPEIKKSFSVDATSLPDSVFQYMEPRGGSHKRKHAHSKSKRSRKTKHKSRRH